MIQQINHRTLGTHYSDTLLGNARIFLLLLGLLILSPFFLAYKTYEYYFK